MSDSQSIPEDRPLTAEETALIHWMLENAGVEEFCSQLQDIRVISRCSCGCASIDFATGHDVAPLTAALSVIADYKYTQGDALCGAFLFTRAGLLAGLEVWSIDGICTPSTVPTADQLVLIDQD